MVCFKRVCALNISGEIYIYIYICKYKWKNANGYNIMERFESEFQNDLEEINSHQCMYRDL